jgi:hypothetical protein
MAMPDQTVAAVRQLQVAHLSQEGLSLILNRLGQQFAGASSQNIRQGIIDRIGLTQAQNIGSLVHGVSLSRRGSGRLDTRLDTPPFSNRHHPLSAIALAPGIEGAIAGHAILSGGKAMTAELEVIVDRSLNGEKLLGLPG